MQVNSLLIKLVLWLNQEGRARLVLNSVASLNYNASSIFA